MSSRNNKSKLLRAELSSIKGFQESQVDMLNQLNQSLSDTLGKFSNFKDSLDIFNESIQGMAKSSNTTFLESVRFQNQIRKRELDLHEKYSNSKLKSIKREEDVITETMRKLEELGDKITPDDLSRYKAIVEQQIGAEESRIRQMEQGSNLLSTLMTKLVDLGKKVADTANRFSDLSNDLISVSGASGADVRETRGTIVQDIISELNSETGMFYNPEKSYEKMINIAKEANIGSLDVIEELTRPMLLATESMDINAGNIAGLMSKWYTRYNFSSHDMEEVLDEIRSNTAGNNSTAEATAKNIARLNNWLEHSAKGDTDKLKAMQSQISQGTSWLESMGISTDRYTEYMADIASGSAASNTTLVAALEKVGLSAMEAQSMFEEGNISKLYEAIYQGEVALWKQAEDNGVKLYSQYAEAYGFDLEGALESYNVANSENFKSLEEFLLSTSNEDNTMVDAVDDKFNTVASKVENTLNSISENIATWQEKWGIGLSDIFIALTSIVTLMKVSNLSGGAGGAGLLGKAGSAISSAGSAATLASGGVLSGGTAIAAGLGTAAVGVAGGIYGAVEATEDFKEGNYGQGALNAAGGAAMLGGAATVLLASNPVGWAIAAAGGLSLLTAKIIESETALSGNAEAVSKQMESIGESLNKENEDRLAKISQLNYQFNQESDISSKLISMKDSGIFKEEELLDKLNAVREANFVSEDTINAKILEMKQNGLTDESGFNAQVLAMKELGLFEEEELNGELQNQLQSMIDSYMDASEAIDSVTDKLLENAEKKFTEIADEQQKGFVGDLSTITDQGDRKSALDLLDDYITDDKLLKKIDKATKDGEITDSEWKKILEGGLFNNSSLKDIELDTQAMKTLDGLLGFGKTYYSSKDMESVLSYRTQLEVAAQDKDKESYDSILKSINESDLKDLFYEQYSDDLSGLEKLFNSYDKGTNYVPNDQLALIHEGEAVVPKKYNPAADTEYIRDAMRDRESRISLSDISKSPNLDVDKLLDIVKRREFSDESIKNDNTELVSLMKEFQTTLTDIKSFLAYWREDSIKRDAVKDKTNKFDYNTYQLSRYRIT